MDTFRIRSDDERVAAAIREIADIIVGHGGLIHPGATIVCDRGDLTVDCDAVPAQAPHPLFRVPMPMLVPTSNLRWSDSDGDMTYLADRDMLTDVQRSLLDPMMTVFNVTGKLTWAKEHLPSLALSQDGALSEALRGVFPYWTASDDGPRCLLGSRVLGGGKDESGAPKSSVLMPLVDYLNHHRRGAGFQHVNHHLNVAVRQLEPGGQCFATYGNRRDALDLAVSYGFAATDVPFARSAQVTVVVPHLGRMVVTRQRPTVKSLVDPPSLTVFEEGIRASHVIFHRDHPERWRANVNLMVIGVVLSRGGTDREAHDAAERAADAIVEANLAALAEIDRAARETPGNAAAEIVRAAAARQAEVIKASV